MLFLYGFLPSLLRIQTPSHNIVFKIDFSRRVCQALHYVLCTSRLLSLRVCHGSTSLYGLEMIAMCQKLLIRHMLYAVLQLCRQSRYMPYLCSSAACSSHQYFDAICVQLCPSNIFYSVLSAYCSARNRHWSLPSLLMIWQSGLCEERATRPDCVQEHTQTGRTWKAMTYVLVDVLKPQT